MWLPDPELAARFILFSDNAAARALFEDDRLLDLLRAHHPSTFEITAQKGSAEVGILTLETEGVVEDLERLTAMHALMRETLTGLFGLGLAAAQAPDLTL